MNPYGIHILHGPHFNVKQNRMMVTIVIGKKRRNINFSKYKMECHLGRILEPHEQVHHINEDHTDDRLENLKVISEFKHKSIHGKQRNPTKSSNFVCPKCQKTFVLSGVKLTNSIVNSRHRPNNKGPYCSRDCFNKSRIKQ